MICGSTATGRPLRAHAPIVAEGDWLQARELLQQASALVHDTRRPRSKDAVDVNLAAVLFEMDAR